MSAIQLIVQCDAPNGCERLIPGAGRLIYRLPMLNAYVIEMDERDARRLNAARGARRICQNARVTAQINAAKSAVNAAFTAGFTGRGVGAAVLDTGVAAVEDLTRPKNRVAAFKDFIDGRSAPYDDNGHGTHVAGIIGGNGQSSGGLYAGMAPRCHIIGVKTLNRDGRGNTSEILAGLQWVVDNADRYNIRIINLSIGTPVIPGWDPLVDAVEAAWDKGLVVVTAAGNGGPGAGSIASPGISRKVITVGTSDDEQSVNILGGRVKNYSGRGPTSECIVKPDILAPGSNIVSCLAPSAAHRKRDRVAGHYVRMSGTSMSTPIISGAIALLLEKYPRLSPDEVKLRLKNSATDLNYPKNRQGRGLLDVRGLLDERAAPDSETYEFDERCAARMPRLI